jgi:hypothetical protein
MSPSNSFVSRLFPHETTRTACGEDLFLRQRQNGYCLSRLFRDRRQGIGIVFNILRAIFLLDTFNAFGTSFKR